MAVGSILGLDFSKKSTGIAFGRPGERPVLSTVSFAKWEGASLDEAASAIIRWLPELLGTYRPDMVVLEAALPPAASRDETSARLALGADFMIRGACHIRRVRFATVHRGTWTAFYLGKGNLKSAEAKARSLAVARGVGLEPRNADEADAAGIWFWACAEFAGHQVDEILPLIAAAQRRAA